MNRFRQNEQGKPAAWPIVVAVLAVTIALGNGVLSTPTTQMANEDGIVEVTPVGWSGQANSDFVGFDR